ncbi:putative leucine-rich repeat-containing protein DDB_G0290503 [Ptychodera flava]|uniref:putative leucine-rich repeat-containing protein DDB_G0290503 n=1 Tax=Ptychodera flava TaxID=63121 RepID=UPI003969E02C
MESPTALIISQEFGDGIQSCMSSTVHLVARMLKGLGINVCCTVFHITESVQRDADEMGIQLVYPNPPERLRQQPMGIQWLMAHKWYFPELSQVHNVTMVFGFGMMTSDVAVKIQSDLYPNADYHHFNLYSLHTPPAALGYKKDEFTFCSSSVTRESNRANAVFSMGFHTFRNFCQHYQQFVKPIKHFQMLPIPDEKFFSHTPHSAEDDETFSVMSLLNTNDIQNLKAEPNILPKALNWVANNMDSSSDKILRWNLLGVPLSEQDSVVRKINPHSRLMLSVQTWQSSSVETELYKSSVVLVLPSSLDNLSLTQAALASGKPVIIPSQSDSHIFVQRFLPRFESSIVVEMQRSPVHLQRKIQHIMQNYQEYLQDASAIRNEMQNVVMKLLADYNKDFIKIVHESTGFLAASNEAKNQTSRNTSVIRSSRECAAKVEEHVDRDGTSENLSEGFARVMEDRKPFQLSIVQKVKSGIPDTGKRIGVIAREFLALDDFKEDMVEVLRDFAGIHKDIFAEYVVNNDRFIVRCQSLEAAEVLWKGYTNGLLDDIINKVLVSRKHLQKIQARYLLLECAIEREEYSILKEELQDYEIQLEISRQGRDSRNVNLVNDEIGEVEEHLKQVTIQVTKLSKAVTDNETMRDTLQLDMLDTSGTYQEQIEQMRSVCHQLEDRLQRNSSTVNLTNQIETVREHIKSLDAVQTALREQSRTNEISELLSSIDRLNQGIPLRDTLRSYGRQGSIPGSYNDPCGLAIKENGDIVVADSGNQRVQAVDANNKCKRIIKFYGFRRKFKPQDVAFLNGTYYIADRSNRQVIVSDKNSRVLALIGVGQLVSPTGLCISKNGVVYVADYCANCVRKYHSGGRLIACTQQGIVIQPHSVTLTKKNLLLVTGQNCVYVLDSDLQLLSTFGEGHLVRPTGICCDILDNIYVCSQGKLYFFNASTQFVCSVSNALTSSDFVAVDSMGRIVCSDNAGNCIKILYT